MLNLSGVPTQARDQCEFSQLMRAWLCKVRSSPAPDIAVVQRQHDDRQAFEVSREHAARINADTTRRARVDDAILALAQGAEGRQAPEKPPVAWVTRKVLEQRLEPFFPGLHAFLSNLSKMPDDDRSTFAEKQGSTWRFDLDALAQHLVTTGKLRKVPDFDAAPERAAHFKLVEKHRTRHVCK